MRVNVRAVAEFYHESGDLTRQGDALRRMQEGTRGHQALQAAYPPGWEKEVPISADVVCEDISLRLYGRMDGLCLSSAPPCLEEIKTTERPIDSICADDVPVHWAQAELYAALLALNENLNAVSIRLTYLNLAGGRVSFTRVLSREALHERLHTYLAPCARWLKSLLRWQKLSRPAMRALPFPYTAYRAGQREMAANVYIALRDSRRLMCQAPTGTGKTVAALYPALKALGEERIDRIFFLTARTTGQRAAEEALQRMRAQGLTARSVTLSARDKICVQPGLPCDPEHCSRARGYYDRRRAALLEALFLQALTPEAVRELADRHELCPFELSLDLSETADVVICDYNYVFDPRVKLQRFFTGRSQAGLLIDEAHNLCARARDMLSATLSQRMFRTLRTRIGKESGRKHALYRTLTALLNEFKALRGDDAEEERIHAQPPAALIRQALEAQSVLGEHMAVAAPWQGELTEAFFALIDFTRCADGYALRPAEATEAADPVPASPPDAAPAGSASPDYRTLLVADGRSMTDVTLLCVNPAPHLNKALRRVHGAALFSATLSPLPFYRDVSGLEPPPGAEAVSVGKRQPALPDALLDLPSPFPPENLMVLRAPLPVRYRQREQSLPALAGLIHVFLTAHPGNYMVFFPSYAYLRQALDALLPLLGATSDAPSAAAEAASRIPTPAADKAVSCALNPTHSCTASPAAGEAQSCALNPTASKAQSCSSNLAAGGTQSCIPNPITDEAQSCAANLAAGEAQSCVLNSATGEAQFCAVNPAAGDIHRADQPVFPGLTLYTAGSLRIIVQSREMDDAARADFLAAFQSEPEHTLAGFAVLGGAFAEGIDLPGNRLNGAVIVGTGVPQVGAVNDALSEVYEAQFGSGYRYAYLYPGITRVLQAAGRVIRSESDRGAVLLIDQRWNDREHLSLLPPHWHTHLLPGGAQAEAALRQALRQFWQK